VILGFAVTFKEWVVFEFGDRGIKKAADFLGYPKRTVYAWTAFNRFPSTKTQEIIRLKSSNQVDFSRWRTQFLSVELKRKAGK
jgi:hypothetical protein